MANTKPTIRATKTTARVVSPRSRSRFRPTASRKVKFFAKMATAATSERELGHTGAFFNYLWSPLGAAAGGEEAAASHFSRIRWMLDLNRRWNGAFDYDCLNGEGPNSGSQV